MKMQMMMPTIMMPLSPVVAVMVACLCVLLAASSPLPTQALKIVAAGLPGGASHHMVLAKIGRELAARGHEFWLIRSDIDIKNVNVDGIHVHVTTSGLNQEQVEKQALRMGEIDPLSGILEILDLTSTFCENLLKDERAWELGRSADVFLVDPAYSCSAMLAELTKPRTQVHISPVAFFDSLCSEIYDVPAPIATVPQLGTHLTPEMNFGQRVFNAINYGVGYILRYYVIQNMGNKHLRAYGSDRQFYDIFDQASAAIYPTDFSFEFPRVISSYSHMVGPILPDPAQPVKNEEMRAIMDGATNGFILVSMGTIARLNEEKAAMFASALNEIGLPVIWKINGAHNINGYANIHIYEWIEQNNILGHANIRAFVAHGGANGVLEAAYHGVPIIGFPMFGDQWDNLMRAVYRGTGLMLDRDTATKEVLVSTIRKIIEDPSFATNAKEISAAIRDHPRTSTERAADIVEWAGHRGPTTRHKMHMVPWHIAVGLDVIAFFGVVALITCAIAFHCCVCTLARCCKKSDKKQQQQQQKKKGDKKKQ